MGRKPGITEKPDKPPVLGFKDRLFFGKYQGATVEQVMAKDAKYLDWAIDEGIIKLDQHAASILNELVVDDGRDGYPEEQGWSPH